MEYVIPHGSGVAVHLNKGHRVKIETIAGGQVSNISFEHFSQALTRDADRLRHGSREPVFNATEGTILYNNDVKWILKIVEDNSVATHDMFFAGCRKEVLDGVKGCLDLLAEALQLERIRVPAPVCIFLDVRDFQLGPTQAKPGDYVVLEALEKVSLGVTSCPTKFHPNPSEIKVTMQ